MPQFTKNNTKIIKHKYHTVKCKIYAFKRYWFGGLHFSFHGSVINCISGSWGILVQPFWGRQIRRDKNVRQSFGVLERHYYEESVQSSHLQDIQHQSSHFSWRQIKGNYIQVHMCVHLPSGLLQRSPQRQFLISGQGHQ